MPCHMEEADEMVTAAAREFECAYQMENISFDSAEEIVGATLQPIIQTG